MRAASSPAGPPPTTITRLRTSAGPGVSNGVVVSRPAATLTTQARRPVVITPATQPIDVPMHGRTSSARPWRTLTTSAGSAISARTIDTRSATPVSTRWAAWSSVMMRPVTIVGTVTALVTTSLEASS